MVRYLPIDGEMVSVQWMRVLKDMRTDGVSSQVLEGHRTFARQRWFWHCYQCQCCNNGNLAAYPSPNAPHIKTGRPDHAIDFTAPDEAVAWLERHGLQPRRTVPGENWHVELSPGAMARYKPKADKYEPLPKHMEHAVRKLLYHRRQAVDEARTGKGKRYRKAVKWRNWWRKRVERMKRRAKDPKRRKLLADALDV